MKPPRCQACNGNLYRDDDERRGLEILTCLACGRETFLTDGPGWLEEAIEAAIEEAIEAGREKMREAR